MIINYIYFYTYNNNYMYNIILINILFVLCILGAHNLLINFTYISYTSTAHRAVNARNAQINVGPVEVQWS